MANLIPFKFQEALVSIEGEVPCKYLMLGFGRMRPGATVMSEPMCIPKAWMASSGGRKPRWARLWLTIPSSLTFGGLQVMCSMVLRQRKGWFGNISQTSGGKKNHLVSLSAMARFLFSPLTLTRGKSRYYIVTLYSSTRFDQLNTNSGWATTHFSWNIPPTETSPSSAAQNLCSSHWHMQLPWQSSSNRDEWFAPSCH